MATVCHSERTYTIPSSANFISLYISAHKKRHFTNRSAGVYSIIHYSNSVHFYIHTAYSSHDAAIRSAYVVVLV